RRQATVRHQPRTRDAVLHEWYCAPALSRAPGKNRDAPQFSYRNFISRRSGDLWLRVDERSPVPDRALGGAPRVDQRDERLLEVARSGSLDRPGDWGYRSSAERREWIADHALPSIDYCDVHNYPRDDHDSFVDSPTALGEFIANRVAAAYSIKKPLVLGEFGMGPEGYNGFTQIDWYRAYFDHAARQGAAG